MPLTEGDWRWLCGLISSIRGHGFSSRASRDWFFMPRFVLLRFSFVDPNVLDGRSGELLLWRSWTEKARGAERSSAFTQRHSGYGICPFFDTIPQRKDSIICDMLELKNLANLGSIASVKQSSKECSMTIYVSPVRPYDMTSV